MTLDPLSPKGEKFLIHSSQLKGSSSRLLPANPAASLERQTHSSYDEDLNTNAIHPSSKELGFLASKDKWIGVHTGGAHGLDHLGVLCAGLQIPLLVSEKETFLIAKQFYPDLHVEYRDLSELSSDFLTNYADVIFTSSHFFAAQFIPQCALLHGKKMRVVYCPHGNSDKNLGTIQKDISLIYGDHMKEHLQKTGEINHIETLVVSGNYRKLYYNTHRKRLDALLQTPSQKTVFYAPTHDTSSFTHTVRIIEEISPFFHLLIRWHPFLHDLYPVESEKLKDVCEKNPNVTDLSSFPVIYPILSQSDFYLGDASSIGYDFLTFNKPLFFLGHSTGEIYNCGIILQEDEHWGEKITQFQDTALLSQKRKALAFDVFGETKSYEQLRMDLEMALAYQEFGN